MVETPLFQAGVEVGPLGYQIVQELARSNLALGVDVVVDLVNPLPTTRRMWPDIATDAGVRLVVFECYLADAEEHRRRIENRSADLIVHAVPTWDEMVEREYAPWDETSDGPRVMVEMTDSTLGLSQALQALTDEVGCADHYRCRTELGRLRR